MNRSWREYVISEEPKVCLLEDKQLSKSGGVDNGQIIHVLASILGKVYALKWSYFRANVVNMLQE